MKTTMLYGLLFLTLLGVGIGCKKEPEPTNTAVYPPGCRIAKTIYKTPTRTRTASYTVVSPETITLDDGTSVQISLIGTDYYKYDAQGRILEVKSVSVNTNYYLSNLIYMGGILIRSTDYYSQSDNNSLLIRKDTLILNEKGTILHAGINIRGPGRQYNTDGQLINKYESTVAELANRYENGNLVWEADTQRFVYVNGVGTEQADRVKQYKYDLTHLNFPPVDQYYGTQSRNLPIEELTSSLDFGPGFVYRKTHTYTFDERGRVKRRVTYGKTLNPQWLLQDDPDGIGVTDYEYQNCL